MKAKNDDLDAELDDTREKLRNFAPSYDELLNVTAALYVSGRRVAEEMEEIRSIIQGHRVAFNVVSSHTPSEETKMRLLEMMVEGPLNEAAEALLKAVAVHKTRQATIAVNTKHDKKGGSRSKQAAIRDLWMSGKYKSRDICAEQECAALDMSFSSARKALRNTPSPP